MVFGHFYGIIRNHDLGNCRKNLGTNVCSPEMFWSGVTKGLSKFGFEFLIKFAFWFGLKKIDPLKSCLTGSLSLS